MTPPADCHLPHPFPLDLQLRFVADDPTVLVTRHFRGWYVTDGARNRNDNHRGHIGKEE
jgi:hypothetical protein